MEHGGLCSHPFDRRCPADPGRFLVALVALPIPVKVALARPKGLTLTARRKVRSSGREGKGVSVALTLLEMGADGCVLSVDGSVAA